MLRSVGNLIFYTAFSSSILLLYMDTLAWSQINWIFLLSCDMLVQKNVMIGIVRAMRLAT